MNDAAVEKEVYPDRAPEAQALRTQFIQKCRLVLTLERNPGRGCSGLTYLLLTAVKRGMVPHVMGTSMVALVERFLGSQQMVSQMYQVKEDGPRKVLDGFIDLWYRLRSARMTPEEDSMVPYLTALVNLVGLYLEALKAQKTWSTLNHEALRRFQLFYPAQFGMWQIFKSHITTPNDIIEAAWNESCKLHPNRTAPEMCASLLSMIEGSLSIMNQVRAATR